MSTIILMIARLSARAGGLIVLLMAFVIATDVLSRSLFGFPVLSGGAGEFSGYALAIVSAWGASLTLLYRAHIRIDIIHSILPRSTWMAFDIFALAAFAAASGLLAWVGSSTFLESLERNAHSMTPLGVPLALPEGLWAAGLVFLFLTSVYLLVKAAYLLSRGDRIGVVALIGTRTAEDDLQQQQQAIQEVAAGGVKHA